MMSPTGCSCGTIGWHVFGGSVKGKACVGYVAFVVLAPSGCLLCVGGQGVPPKEWSAPPKNRWVFGLRCPSVRSIDVFVSCGSWLQMGAREIGKWVAKGDIHPGDLLVLEHVAAQFGHGTVRANGKIPI